MNELQPDANAFIEGLRAQRTEAQDAGARWFALYVTSKAALDKSEARVKELEDKYEPKPAEAPK